MQTVLSLLTASGDRFLSGEAMSQALGVTRAVRELSLIHI